MLHVRGGTVVDADGAREADVAIEGDRIVTVGDVSGEPDTVIDATDRYVAPGLIDAHVHLVFGGAPDPGQYLDDSTATLTARAAGNGRALVESGVTTVRDLGAPDGVAIDVATAVESGTITGSRVVASGQNIVMTGGHGHWFGREADGPIEVRKAVREQVKRGAGVVKTMATGGVLTEGAETGAVELTSEELEALVETAERAGRPTAAHAHGDAGIRNATEAGITSIEHGTFMSEETAHRMADAGTWWVPTASALRGIVDHGVDAGIPDWAVEKAEEAEAAFEDAFAHALAADVPIAMGTDAGTPFNYHADVPQELVYMVEYGMDPADALHAATAGGAELLGLDETGYLREEYRANCVVLNEDPRATVETWQDPAAVIAAGEYVV